MKNPFEIQLITLPISIREIEILIKMIQSNVPSGFDEEAIVKLYNLFSSKLDELKS